MRYQIHPQLRYVLGRAALDALPSTGVAGGLLYGFIATYPDSFFVLFFGFGTAVMLLVAIGRFSSHLWWLSRATQLVSTTQPVPMYLTADAGWKKITLRPVDLHSTTPIITGVRFIILGSGVPTQARQEIRVDVYLDNAYTDLIVLRLGKALLCSEVKQRFEQGHASPVRETPQATGAVDIATIHPTAGSAVMTPVNPQILQDIEALAQGMQSYMPMVIAICVILIVFCLGLTGTWRLFVDWRQALTQEPMGIMGILFSVVFCGVAVYIVNSLLRQPQRIRRGAWVVQQSSPMPQRLVVRSKVISNSDSSRTEWYIDISDPQAAVDSSVPVSVKLLTEMSEERATAITGTIGQVYALADIREPVVIQTSNGVAIGVRKA